MNFKPSTFHIGIIDLFAILLPGAILSIMLYQMDVEVLQSSTPSGRSIGLKTWVNELYTTSSFLASFVFLLSSYVLGHFLVVLGSLVLDKLYDKLNGVYIFKKEKYRRNLNSIKKIREQLYRDYSLGDYLSNFEWSKYKLYQDNPSIIAEIEKHQAHSKFFRSLVLILPVISIALSIHGNLALGVFTAVLMIFAFYRYVERKRKSTETAYKNIVLNEYLLDPNTVSVTPFENGTFDKMDKRNKVQFERCKEMVGSENFELIKIEKESNWRHQLKNSCSLLCIEGNGQLQYLNRVNSELTNLCHNALIPIEKDSIIHIQNKSRSEDLQLAIVLK